MKRDENIDLVLAELKLTKSPDLSLRTVTTEFRKFALRNHPDKNPSKDAEALFKKVSSAFDTFKDLSLAEWQAEMSLKPTFAFTEDIRSTPKRNDFSNPISKHSKDVSFAAMNEYKDAMEAFITNMKNEILLPFSRETKFVQVQDYFTVMLKRMDNDSRLLHEERAECVEYLRKEKYNLISHVYAQDKIQKTQQQESEKKENPHLFQKIRNLFTSEKTKNDKTQQDPAPQSTKKK